MDTKNKIDKAMKILAVVEQLGLDDYHEDKNYNETISLLSFYNIITENKKEILYKLNEADPCECYYEIRKITEDKIIYLLVI
jgi:hypothetical protein